jgi:pilus assembly protein CpaE
VSGERIKVFIVDDHESTVQTISSLLRLEKDFEIVGTSGDGITAVDEVAALAPDVVLMDVNMPRMDGITATEVIRAKAPDVAVVMLTGEADQELLRRSMNVGASYFLNKPVSPDELFNALRRSHEQAQLRKQHYMRSTPLPEAPTGGGTVVALFSPSGGVGRTTIAVNLAIALQRVAAKPTALVDLSIPFGDVGVLLNARPDSRTIADLVGKFGEADARDVEGLLIQHASGIRALLAPPSPQAGELITADDVRKILLVVRSRYAFVIVDTYPSYSDPMIAVLEEADTILLPLTLELTSVKNARVFIELRRKLQPPLDDKVKLLLNRGEAAVGLKLADVETGLGRKVEHILTTDEQSLRIAMNRGQPVLDTHAGSRLSKDFLAMARGLAGMKEPAAAAR